MLSTEKGVHVNKSTYYLKYGKTGNLNFRSRGSSCMKYGLSGWVELFLTDIGSRS
jgi:hypothetical protein